MPSFPSPAMPPPRGGFFRLLTRIVILVIAALAGMMLYNVRHFSSHLTGPGSIGSSLREGSAGERVPLSVGKSQPGIGPIGGLGKIGTNTSDDILESSGYFWSSWFSGTNDPRQESINNTNALLEAAAEGDTEKVERLLTKKLSIDGRDDNGRTALMFASWNGKNAICADLLAAGADPTLTDHHDLSAIDYAAGRGLIETTHLLLKKSEDAHHDLEYAHLVRAAYTGDITQLPRGKPSTINRLNPEGEAPLHIAAGNGSAAVAAELIKRGADVNVTNHDKQAPLHWAAWNNQPQSVALLALHGANLSLRDSGGNTPLMLAAEHGSKEAAQMLLQKGADKTAVNAKGQSASAIARDKGFDDLAKLLR